VFRVFMAFRDAVHKVCGDRLLVADTTPSSWQRMRMAASNHRRSHRAWGSFTKAFFSYDPWTAHFDSESTQSVVCWSWV